MSTTTPPRPPRSGRRRRHQPLVPLVRADRPRPRAPLRADGRRDDRRRRLQPHQRRLHRLAARHRPARRGHARRAAPRPGHGGRRRVRRRRRRARSRACSARPSTSPRRPARSSTSRRSPSGARSIAGAVLGGLGLLLLHPLVSAARRGCRRRARDERLRRRHARLRPGARRGVLPRAARAGGGRRAPGDDRAHRLDRREPRASTSLFILVLHWGVAGAALGDGPLEPRRRRLLRRLAAPAQRAREPRAAVVHPLARRAEARLRRRRRRAAAGRLPHRHRRSCSTTSRPPTATARSRPWASRCASRRCRSSCVMGVTLGVLPLLAYSYGKGDRARLTAALRASAITVGGIALLFVDVVFVFREQVFSAFVADPSVLAIGVTILTAQLVAMVANGFAGLITSLFQATGRALAGDRDVGDAGRAVHPDRAARQPLVRARRHHLGADRHRGPRARRRRRAVARRPAARSTAASPRAARSAPRRCSRRDRWAGLRDGAFVVRDTVTRGRTQRLRPNAGGAPVGWAPRELPTSRARHGDQPEHHGPAEPCAPHRGGGGRQCRTCHCARAPRASSSLWARCSSSAWAATSGSPLRNSSTSSLVRLSPPVVFVRVGVEQAEAEPDVPLTSPPQQGEDPLVPGGHSWRHEGEVERAVVVIDVVHAPLGVAERGGDLVELVEPLVGQAPDGVACEVGFEEAAVAVDGVQLVEVERGDGGTASGRVDDQALGLENAQGVAHRE